ncbi:hypothetical protein [Nonomuraea terrae]|uniref:hypothetical protein n=1 Tax=Nonomuraea terrae TaxID=2530383 RepID=UPI001FEBB266|nr:hypothetical protein [Nonomuraea terrae]
MRTARLTDSSSTSTSRCRWAGPPPAAGTRPRGSGRRAPGPGRPGRGAELQDRAGPVEAPSALDRDVRDVDLSEVSVHVGPRCHFVRYGLRGGEMLNQVAVFESPKALAGEEDWGTPDELDHAFAATCPDVQAGIPLMWRDRWWRMFDRDPIMTWVDGNIALLGDAAHPPLQYMAQGAVMAIEDGWVLAKHVAARRADDGSIDWRGALAAYEAVRPEHCRRVLTTARAWGELWHLDGVARLRRNTLLRARDTHDYSFTDWIYGPTALTPEEEPPMFTPIPLDSVDVSGLTDSARSAASGNATPTTA